MTDTETIPKEIEIKVISGKDYIKLTDVGRKYYMRLKRKTTNTGVEEKYDEFIKQLGINRIDADKIFYQYVQKKYPALVKLILNNNK